MNAAFIDTAFLIALAFKDDAWHQRAASLFNVPFGRLVTTDYVIVEFGDGVCSERNRHILKLTLHAIRQDPRIDIVPASPFVLDAAITLYHSRQDKQWSLTDCTSFIVMGNFALSDALTSDHHFEQAGFRALLRE